MSTTVTKREVITYSNSTWEVEVSENANGGITYSLFAKGTNTPFLEIDTKNLVQLEQIVNQLVPNIHADRSKLLS